MQLAQSRRPDGDAMRGAYLGPQFGQTDTEKRLQACGARFSVLDDRMLVERSANDLAQRKAMGWFQGRMEFCPRALGNRSYSA